jgi:hypothetical protein
MNNELAIHCNWCETGTYSIRDWIRDGHFSYCSDVCFNSYTKAAGRNECDYCHTVKPGNKLPDGWVAFGKEKYCGKWCAVTHWDNIGTPEHAEELA